MIMDNLEKEIMKKVFIITKVSIMLLAVALLISIIGGVSAVSVDTVGLKTNPSTGSADVAATGETVVEYGVSSGYKLYVPVDFEFSDQIKTVESQVVVSNITLSTNQRLNLSVTSEHGWVLMQHELVNGVQKPVDTGDTIPYSMKFGTTILDKHDSKTCLITSVDAGNSDVSVDVTFELDTSVQITVAASYRDRLSFTAKIDTV